MTRARLIDSVLDFIFPRQCAGCRRMIERGDPAATRGTCDACLESIPLARGLMCGKCGAAIPAVLGPRSVLPRSPCHRGFAYVLGAASTYDNDVLKNIVWAAKFGFSEKAAEVLGAVLAKYLENSQVDWSRFAAVPVPLPESRERVRGFNQSAAIARTVAAEFGMDFLPSALERGYARPQSELKNLEERRQNVKGTFKVREAGSVAGRNVALFDDVVTSGSTFAEAAAALKSAGAKKIVALAAARA